MFNTFIDTNISHSLSNLIGEYKICDLRKYKSQAYINELKPFKVSMKENYVCKITLFFREPSVI